ncbi:MAG: DUF3054 domain-containing protein [Acidimicrobiia bacterium]
MKEKLASPVGAFVVDVAVIVFFVTIGRRNHDEAATVSGYLGTMAPFLIALAAVWLASRAWRSPVSARTGVTVWVVTVALGMVVRRFVFDDGTATAFVIVATVFNGAVLNGWRAIVRRSS